MKHRLCCCRIIWTKIGIKVNLEKVAWATFRDRVDKGDFQLAMGTWSPDYADPQFFMSYWFDSGYFGLAGNRAFYKIRQWMPCSAKQKC